MKLKDALRRVEGLWTSLWDPTAYFTSGNLQQFISKRAHLPVESRTTVPQLNLFRQTGEDWKEIPVYLKDDSADTNAIVRPSAINLATGRPLGEDLGEISDGQAVYEVTLENGCRWHYTKSAPDSRIYVVSFQVHHTPRTDYHPSIEELASEALIRARGQLGSIKIR